MAARTNMEWINLQSAMISRLMAIIGQSDKQEAQWYAQWGAVLAAYGKANGITTAQSCALFAALSPRKNIARNWRMYCKALADGPLAVNEATKATREKAALILADAHNPIAYLKGPKTNAFARNLLGDLSRVTVDSITLQAAMGDRSLANVGTSMYGAVSAAIIQCAWLLGWEPANTQAVIWEQWRKGKPNMAGHCRAYGDPNPTELLRLVA